LEFISPSQQELTQFPAHSFRVIKLISLNMKQEASVLANL